MYKGSSKVSITVLCKGSRRVPLLYAAVCLHMAGSLRDTLCDTIEHSNEHALREPVSLQLRTACQVLTTSSSA